MHTNIKIMLKTLIFTLLIVAIAVILLCIKIIFVKNGRFPNSHVSGNKHMRKRGIGCVQSQDREAQKKKLYTAEMMEEILKNN